MWKMKGGAAPPGQQSMRGERGVQGERDGFGLGTSFAFHWRALSARARYRRMWKMKGGGAPPGQQLMRGERGVQGERDGFRLGCSFAFHWRALSARARYLFCISLACALTRERLTLPRPFGARRVRSCPKQLQAFAVFQRERATLHRFPSRPANASHSASLNTCSAGSKGRKPRSSRNK